MELNDKIPLQKCPFCGGEAELCKVTERVYNTWETLFIVKCKRCACKTDSYFNKHEAAERWERRVDNA